jgi:hypothetical protein
MGGKQEVVSSEASSVSSTGLLDVSEWQETPRSLSTHLILKSCIGVVQDAEYTKASKFVIYQVIPLQNSSELCSMPMYCIALHR